jgi:Domain of Unknown Function with PDB structure (DUF3857)/Transglutaminase-like superfamily
MPSLRKTTSSTAVVLLVVALVGCFAPRAKAGDSAPDWLRAAAQEKLPDYDKDTVAVIVLDETQTTVQPNGEIDTRYRQAIRLLRPEARRDYSSLDVPFDKETKISYMKAWTIEANGHQMAVGDKDVIEHGMFESLDYEYTDVRLKTLDFPEANPGNVVGFEFVQRHRPYVFEDDWGFQNEVPVKTARLILQIPAGWEFTTNWFNHPEQKPVASGSNQYVWEVDDVPAMEIEPDMPAWRSLAGWVGLKYFPKDPAMRARTTGSWNDLALWYDGLTQSSRIASPEIKQKVAELTSGLSDPLSKIRAITEFMQRSIRYYAIEVGIGGYQPHPAAEVFAHQFGDCKDKATLLSSMLHEIGIDSYYVLVDSDRGVVRPGYPSMNFDHVILAMRLPDTVSTTALYAFVNDPKLGPLLIFDPTEEHTPLGYLPWQLQDSDALIVSPDGGEMVHLPLLPPATNRLLRVAKFDLTASGDLAGEVQQVEWGGPAAAQREEFLGAPPSKRADIFEHFLGGFLNNFLFLGGSLGNLGKDDESLSLDYKFLSRGYANASGDLLILRPDVVGNEDIGLLNLFTQHKARKYPVEFEEAMRQDDVFDITLPPGYALDGLPQPVQASCDYATYHSEIKVSDGVLHYKRTFEVKDVIVPVDRLPEIRAFLEQVAADQQSSAVLKKTATP